MRVPKTFKRAARAILPAGIANGIAARVNRPNFPPITPMRPEREWNSNLRETRRWFEHASGFLRVNRINGVYAEFGSHEVNTFRIALNTLGQYGQPIHISRFYAFDSFQGMPEPQGIDRQKIWRKGMNATSLEAFTRICARDMHRVTAVKGFFEESLPVFPWPAGEKIAVAYIDVDYYVSTRQALAFIAGKLQHGSIVAFDDWNCYYADPLRGQRKAFAEFRESMKDVAAFEPFLPISFGGMSFIYQERSKLGTAAL